MHFAAFAGKFPSEGAYSDARHSRPLAGDFLDANLGRFPLIQTPQGVAIGQSSAINYYVASVCGLMGETATEAALVLSFSAHVQVRNSKFNSTFISSAHRIKNPPFAPCFVLLLPAFPSDSMLIFTGAARSLGATCAFRQHSHRSKLQNLFRERRGARLERPCGQPNHFPSVAPSYFRCFQNF